MIYRFIDVINDRFVQEIAKDRPQEIKSKQTFLENLLDTIAVCSDSRIDVTQGSQYILFTSVCLVII